MNNTNKSYRIKATPGDDKNINVKLDQSYNVLDILSVRLNQENDFKLHSSNYGIIVGRVVANGGFGVPNAKVSIFISANDEPLGNDPVLTELYPFTSLFFKNKNNVRYNLLPDYEVDDCHQAIGNMPSKQYILDNDSVLEIFDKFYKFTTRTNESGDYFLSGIPVGEHNIHMDVDLSDCGILSQRPRDFVYKGYNIEQFETPNQFKTSKEIDKLSQVLTQNKTVNVIPFWGNEENDGEIGITRTDFEISFKFEPTCVFIGSIIGDNKSNGISPKCVPTENMGAMDELVSGEGRIEMIRKRPDGDVEELQIKGTELINSNGVWCYQIPMNLDYMVTDEYGNMVPSDNPEKGLPTRARVRFRMSMSDFEENNDFYHRAKILVPHNPDSEKLIKGTEEVVDYNFGTSTKDRSFRDLFWDNVYTVKSYIPRLQKAKKADNPRFTGIKHCNIYGNNNPMPYNNIRIKMPFMFTVLCAIINMFVKTVGFLNWAIYTVASAIAFLGRNIIGFRGSELTKHFRYMTLYGLCPDLDNWYFAPGGRSTGEEKKWYKVDILKNTYDSIFFEDATDSEEKDLIKNITDESSIDYINRDDELKCLTTNTEYLISCIEMALAQEYKVINFDFYNDWVNGVLYFPRWARYVRKKRTYFFNMLSIREKTRGCMSNPSIFGQNRNLVQQCALEYKFNANESKFDLVSRNGCGKGDKFKCHAEPGKHRKNVFGSKYGGIVKEHEVYVADKTSYVYYLRPCEFSNGIKVNLFATDLVLLGSLKMNNKDGIPQAFMALSSSSYKLPTNLALTNMEDTGYIYGSKESDTICNRNQYPSSPNNPDVKDIKSNSGEQNFKKTEQMYNGVNDDIKFEKEDDAIPVTEAAGIAWNYTGPGQGKEDRSKMYLPGGMFLGLSCFNTETNVKSCVNLQRVCEQGAEISQRHEKIRKIEVDSNGNSKFYYYYIVPNGIIGKNEISSESFRSMFATLNSKKLFADNINEETGYPEYSFRFYSPISFNGELDKITSNPIYSKIVDTSELADLMKDSTTRLDRSASYDEEEDNYTFLHPSEISNEDYIKFRLGLDKLTTDTVRSKFLIGPGSRVVRDTVDYLSMPVFENSFYFYFGIKEGATALDEFKKQFFSVCAAPKYFNEIMSASGSSMGGDLCSMKDSITVYINRGQAPYTITLDNTTNNTKIKKEGIMDSTYEFKDIDFGNYNVIVEDSIKNRTSFSIICGFNKFLFDYNQNDFIQLVDSTNHKDVLEKYSNTKLGEREKIGGFLEIGESINVNDELYNLFESADEYVNVCLFITDGSEYICQYSGPQGPTNYPEGFEKLTNLGKNFISHNGDKTYVHLWEPEKVYSIYIGTKCSGSDEYTYTLYDKITINGVNYNDFYQGCQYLSYNNLLSKLKKNWWEENYNSPYLDASNNNDKSKWLIHHFSTKQTEDKYSEFKPNFYPRDNSYSRIITGFPEKTEGSNEYLVMSTVQSSLYQDDYSKKGFELSDNYISVPTYNPRGSSFDDKFENEYDPETIRGKNIRSCFGIIYYNHSKSVIGKPLDCTFRDKLPTEYKYIINNLDETFNRIIKGQRVLLKIKNDIETLKVKNILTNGGETILVIDTRNDIITKYNNEDLRNSLIYVPHYFPIIYEPFYANIGSMEYMTYELEIGKDEKENDSIENVLSYTYINKFTCRTCKVNAFNRIRYSGSDKIGNFIIDGIDYNKISGRIRYTSDVDGYKRVDSVLTDEVKMPISNNEGLSVMITEEAPSGINTDNKYLDGNGEAISLNKIDAYKDLDFTDDIIFYDDKSKTPSVYNYSENNNYKYFEVDKSRSGFEFPLKNSTEYLYRKTKDTGLFSKTTDIDNVSAVEVIVPIYAQNRFVLVGISGTYDTEKANYTYKILCPELAGSIKDYVTAESISEKLIDKILNDNFYPFKKISRVLPKDGYKNMLDKISELKTLNDWKNEFNEVDARNLNMRGNSKYIISVEFDDNELDEANKINSFQNIKIYG